MIINQLFRLLISTVAPLEVEERISWFLPEDGQLKKKKRMHEDLWFFKDSLSKRGAVTSYWSYRDETDRISGTPGITDWGNREVYCQAYNLRNSTDMVAGDFITWKEGLTTERPCYREAYESLLFNADGEETEPLKMLNPTDEFIELEEGNDNRGVFLREPDMSDNPIGITILNIISKAMDGKYEVEFTSSGFGGDDTGDYENEVVTIYNSPGKSSQFCICKEPGLPFKKFIAHEYEKWIAREKFSGLIIGDREEDDLSNIMERTEEGERFFSIFLKPNWEDITGGYWGYRRDEIIKDENGTHYVNGPRAQASMWNRFRSQNEIDDALERGIVLDREIK